MKGKGKRRTGLWVLVFLILLAAGLVAYFAFSKPTDKPVVSTSPQGTETPASGSAPAGKRSLGPGTGVQGASGEQSQAVPERPDTRAEAEGPVETGVQDPTQPPTPSGERTQPGLGPGSGRGPGGISGGGLRSGEMASPGIEQLEDECARLEQDVRDFFRYLDGQTYVQEAIGDTEAWTVFTRALAKLSEQPPLPAGEGLDPALLAKNIYHLYRTLDDGEILFARKVIRHEADTLELNLDVFYRWLTLGDRCPDPDGVRPSQEVLYRYAGFFMNTIGGRAYLFRRPSRLRLLVSYYAILILHRADREGRNRYGIDVAPMVEQVKEDMARYDSYYYLPSYLKRLEAVEAYYQSRRSSRTRDASSGTPG